MSHILIPKGVTSPSISDVITANGQTLDLTGSLVRFRMRAYGGTTLKVDASASIENQTTNEGGVRYDWASTDLDTAGEFEAWWRVTLPNSQVQELNEFLIIVDEHSPGVGVLTGSIAERIRMHIPATWTAMRQDLAWGDIRLQTAIDLTKFRLFGTIVAADQESVIYNTLIIDFTAKVALLEIIPAAVDFWSSKPISLSTKTESETFPDRIAALWKLYDRIRADVEELRPEVEGMIPIVTRRKGAVPLVDTSVEDLITSDPQHWGRAFADPNRNPALPWTFMP